MSGRRTDERTWMSATVLSIKFTTRPVKTTTRRLNRPHAARPPLTCRVDARIFAPPLQTSAPERLPPKTTIADICPLVPVRVMG